MFKRVRDNSIRIIAFYEDKIYSRKSEVSDVVKIIITQDKHLNDFKDIETALETFNHIKEVNQRLWDNGKRINRLDAIFLFHNGERIESARLIKEWLWVKV